MKSLYSLEVIKTSIGTEVKRYQPDPQATAIVEAVKALIHLGWTPWVWRITAKMLRANGLALDLATACEAIAAALEEEQKCQS